jgi:hypothetical protein
MSKEREEIFCKFVLGHIAGINRGLMYGSSFDYIKSQDSFKAELMAILSDRICDLKNMINHSDIDEIQSAFDVWISDFDWSIPWQRFNSARRSAKKK